MNTVAMGIPRDRLIAELERRRGDRERIVGQLNGFLNLAREVLYA